MEEAAAEKALILLRSRLCNPNFLFTPLSDYPDSNYSKLKFIITNSITEACNNSLLLLGPRGCGKTAVLELVLRDLNVEYPNMISLVRLNGLLHSDDNCAVKEIARQLCLEHQLLFSKMASFDDNTQFMIATLRECGLAHKTIIFVLNEFDLFTQGKQRLLYSLLDALQSLTSQAVVIGVSCRLDADQLLEKRVRSRFSHRKLLFVPPSTEDIQRLLEHILSLPTDLAVPRDYAAEFNARIHNIVGDHGFVEILNSLSNVDASVSYLLRFLFHAVSFMDLESGFLSLENFRTAIWCIQRQPKLETLQEYKSVHDAYQTSDYYARNVCLRAFEHLLERELVSFTDSRGHNPSIEFRPVKLLVASQELYQGLQSNRSCPAILQKLFNRESYK